MHDDVYARVNKKNIWSYFRRVQLGGYTLQYADPMRRSVCTAIMSESRVEPTAWISRYGNPDHISQGRLSGCMERLHRARQVCESLPRDIEPVWC